MKFQGLYFFLQSFIALLVTTLSRTNSSRMVLVAYVLGKLTAYRWNRMWLPMIYYWGEWIHFCRLIKIENRVRTSGKIQQKYKVYNIKV